MLSHFLHTYLGECVNEREPLIDNNYFITSAIREKNRVKKLMQSKLVLLIHLFIM